MVIGDDEDDNFFDKDKSVTPMGPLWAARGCQGARVIYGGISIMRLGYLDVNHDEEH